MITATVKNNLKFPKFHFQEDLRFIAEQQFIPRLKQYIEKQVGVDESPLLPNNPKYTMRKIAKGLNPKILMATGTLHESFYSYNRGKNMVVITLGSDRKKIGGYLVDMGKNFFGISSRMEQDAMNYMERKIDENIKNPKPIAL